MMDVDPGGSDNPVCQNTDILELETDGINEVVNTKTSKRSKSRKSVTKKVKHHQKDTIVYQKPVRVPLNFEDLERSAVFDSDSNNESIVPDYVDDSEDLVDISNVALSEYDSEDQQIIKILMGEEVEKRKISRENKHSKDGQRRHLTGSARSEGYYVITSAEKKAHLRVVSQKNRDASTSPSKIVSSTNITNDMRISSSRASRFTQRQLFIGPESKKPPVPIDSAESVRYKQMKNRKRRLKFAKSDIHDWGLFAMEKIEANDMIIEYIGEKIRLKIADLRELEYEKQGIGSSYLFRVIDATKMGNLARFINHCCEVNLGISHFSRIVTQKS